MRFPDNVLLSLSVALAFALPVYAQQSAYSPPSPIFPKGMAECDKFQTDYQKFTSQLTNQHQSCLDAHKTNKSVPTAGPIGKAATPEPSITCSVPACQSLHTRMYSAMSTGQSEVAACRQKVQNASNEQAKRKQEQEAAARSSQEDQQQARDNQQRKEYGDHQERAQASRDAAARKKASEDAAARKKQDEQLERQKEQQDKAASDASRGPHVSGTSASHDAWKAREDKRRAKIEQLEDAAASIEDEQQRHAALGEAIGQIQQIKAQSKQDPEPK